MLGQDDDRKLTGMMMSAHQDSWIGIEAAAYFFAGEDAGVSAWAELMGLAPEAHNKIVSEGHVRYFPGHGDPVGSLCSIAITRLLEENALRADDVDILIHAHTLITSVEAPPQSMVSRIASDLGMQRANALSISNLHCASMVGALRIVMSMMATDATLQNVVIVTADTRRGRELSHHEQPYVHSDGAAAIWVRRNATRNRISAIEIENFSQYHMGYMMKPEQRGQYNMTLQIRTLQVIERAIRKAGLTSADIVKLVPYNMGRPAWLEIGKRLSSAEDFVFDRNIANKGHACCSDIAVNLVDGAFLDRRRDGGAIAAVARGATGACAAFILQAA